MSIVKYKNKKTGAISIYESTSHYDPEKNSRALSANIWDVKTLSLEH